MTKLTDTNEGQTVTRSSLAKVLEADTFTAKESYAFVSDFFTTLREKINEHGKVKVQGFGTFRCIDKTARIGRNPKTKKEALICGRRVVSFTSSRKFKKDLNELP